MELIEYREGKYNWRTGILHPTSILISSTLLFILEEYVPCDDGTVRNHFSLVRDVSDNLILSGAAAIQTKDERALLCCLGGTYGTFAPTLREAYLWAHEYKVDPDRFQEKHTGGFHEL